MATRDAVILWALAILCACFGELTRGRYPTVAGVLWVGAGAFAFTGTVVFVLRLRDWRSLSAAAVLLERQRAYAAGRAETFAANRSLIHETRQFLREARETDTDLRQFALQLFLPPLRAVRVGNEQGSAGFVVVLGYEDAQTGVQLLADSVLRVILDGADDRHIAPKRRYHASPLSEVQWELAYRYLVNRGYVEAREYTNVAPNLVTQYSRDEALALVSAELYPHLRNQPGQWMWEADNA